MMRKTAFAICLGLLLLHGNSALAETRELVIASWGGNYEEGWRKSLVPAFEIL